MNTNELKNMNLEKLEKIQDKIQEIRAEKKQNQKNIAKQKISKEDKERLKINYLIC